LRNLMPFCVKECITKHPNPRPKHSLQHCIDWFYKTDLWNLQFY
jgi:hypothetical protein